MVNCTYWSNNHIHYMCFSPVFSQKKKQPKTRGHVSNLWGFVFAFSLPGTWLDRALGELEGTSKPGVWTQRPPVAQPNCSRVNPQFPQKKWPWRTITRRKTTEKVNVSDVEKSGGFLVNKVALLNSTPLGSMNENQIHVFESCLARSFLLKKNNTGIQY